MPAARYRLYKGNTSTWKASILWLTLPRQQNATKRSTDSVGSRGPHVMRGELACCTTLSAQGHFSKERVFKSINPIKIGYLCLEGKDCLEGRLLATRQTRSSVSVLLPRKQDTSAALYLGSERVEIIVHWLFFFSCASSLALHCSRFGGDNATITGTSAD
nr:hypothetical protein CFP56_75872 [Quercus suber]